MSKKNKEKDFIKMISKLRESVTPEDQPPPPKNAISPKTLNKKTQLLFVEDGSLDIDELSKAINGTNIQIIVYRQGSNIPKLVEVSDERMLFEKW